MQEGDILTAREAAYIERLEIENGELQRLNDELQPPPIGGNCSPEDIARMARISEQRALRMLGNEADAHADTKELLQALIQRISLLDYEACKQIVATARAEAAEQQRRRELTPKPAPAPLSMPEADCIAADLHNSRRKAPKAHAAQTKSAVALEFKHAQQGVDA